MLYLLIGLAVYLVLANLLISRYVWRDSERKMNEKIAETGLVWLVPFFGHLVVLGISLEGAEKVRKTNLATATATATATGAAAGAISGTSYTGSGGE